MERSICCTQLCRVRVRAIRVGVEASVFSTGSTRHTPHTSASATKGLPATTVNMVGFYQLRQLRTVRKSLPTDARCTVVVAFIASRVD